MNNIYSYEMSCAVADDLFRIVLEMSNVTGNDDVLVLPYLRQEVQKLLVNNESYAKLIERIAAMKSAGATFKEDLESWIYGEYGDTRRCLSMLTVLEMVWDQNQEA